MSNWPLLFRTGGICVLCLMALINPASAEQQTTSATLADGTASALRLAVLFEQFDEPWGMDFLPDGKLLVTEQGGTLNLVDIQQRSSRRVGNVPASVQTGQGGLMDVLVHTDAQDTTWVYLSYTVEQDGRYSTRVSRATFDGRSLGESQQLFTAEPYFRQRRHFGSRLLIDDGFLYITVGDRGNRDLAQSLASHNGKVIRLTEDGAVPEDNPFVGAPDALPEIWSYGHRNPQGIAKHPVNGDIWIAEHGPQGGDEINRVLRGGNFGWPVITYGEEYGGGSIGEGTEKENMQQPLAYYVPSIGTAGIGFYTGDKYRGWNNSLLVAGLAQPQISRLELDGDRLGNRTRLLGDLKMRVRDVQQGPDGYVYVLLDKSLLGRLEPDNT